MKFDKYRIVENDGWFYPQVRFLFIFWSNFLIFVPGMFNQIAKFKTLKEANKFVALEINEQNRTRVKIIHGIKHEL